MTRKSKQRPWYRPGYPKQEWRIIIDFKDNGSINTGQVACHDLDAFMVWDIRPDSVSVNRPPIFNIKRIHIQPGTYMDWYHNVYLPEMERKISSKLKWLDDV